MAELKEPVGAIWVKNWKLMDSLRNFLNTVTPICKNCHEPGTLEFSEKQLNEAIKAHTLAVKVKVLKEKFIAIENTRKHTPKQPDYFLHVYQTHTGAAVSSPFGDSKAEDSQAKLW